MENKNISQIVLERIKESGIRPISKNVFNFRRVLFWSLVGFSVIVGAVTFSIMISILLSNDWYLYNKFGFNFILKTLPYFWFVFLALVTVLGEFYYRKTLLGYRHRVVAIVGMYIILTVIIGTVLYMFGTGDTFEQSLSEKVPIYHVVIFDRDEIWFHPEEGLLSGKIIGINNNMLQVLDFNSTVWAINISDSDIDKNTQIKIGGAVKAVGYIDNNGIFVAEEIHP